MENSILKSTKKVVGIPEDYTVFDPDIMLHINSVFSTLQQLGLGPIEGFMIEDELVEWSSYTTDLVQLGLIRSYMHLKVRMLFDPPTLSYMITSMEKQIDQMEWRLNVMREYARSEEVV